MDILKLHMLSEAEDNTVISQLDRPRHESGKTGCEGLNEHGLKDEEQELNTLTSGPYSSRL